MRPRFLISCRGRDFLLLFNIFRARTSIFSHCSSELDFDSSALLSYHIVLLETHSFAARSGRLSRHIYLHPVFFFGLPVGPYSNFSPPVTFLYWIAPSSGSSHFCLLTEKDSHSGCGISENIPSFNTTFPLYMGVIDIIGLHHTLTSSNTNSLQTLTFHKWNRTISQQCSRSMSSDLCTLSSSPFQ